MGSAGDTAESGLITHVVGARSGVAAVLVAARGADFERATLVIPPRPRGGQELAFPGPADVPRVQVVDPLKYLDLSFLVYGSRAAIADSEGVRKETAIPGGLRPNTDHPFTIPHGTKSCAAITTVGRALLEVRQEEPTRVNGSASPVREDKDGGRIADANEDWVEAA